MMGLVKIRERGSTPRRMRKALNANMKETWADAGREYHEDMRPERFTPEHARRAGYHRTRFYLASTRRNPNRGGGPGKADPLVFTGETKRAVRLARISSTSKGVRVAYPGARQLNRSKTKSGISPAAYFRAVLPNEGRTIARSYDRRLDRRLNTDTAASTETVNA